MNEENASSFVEKSVDRAVAEGGAYEVLRKRLEDQGKRLSAFA